jgi:flagellin
VAFQINTNIPSLQAQEYLRVNSEMQSKTINRVTSGLRIVSSGDDAAGLAIANGFRSDQAVLTQGVRNANDGLSTLQIIDGGINNISKLIDRARTLATQSASGTFTGSRSVLNDEFQSLLTEIDRQAQAVGLNTDGQFAKMLKVFVGGGRAAGGVTEIANGSVAVDLSNSAVDSKSLGMKGVQAAGVAGTDIGTGAAKTSVQQILSDSTNLGSEAVGGYTDFYFYGPGFGDSNRVKVSVSTAGVTDTATLASAINKAVEAAGNGTTQAATAFKNAGITANIVTDASGKKQLAFASSNSAFQVRAGDRMANALMGNFVNAASGASGKDLAVTFAGSGAVTGANTWTAGAGIMFRFQGGGLSSPIDLTVNVTGGATTVTQAVADLSSQVANNATLKAAGISLTNTGTVTFTSSQGQGFEVLVAGDVENQLKFNAFLKGGAANNEVEYTTITGGAAPTVVNGATQQLRFDVGGSYSATVNITMATGDTAATLSTKINDAIAQNATLSAAGLSASNSSGKIQIASANGSYFRLMAEAPSGANSLGFAGGVAYSAVSAATPLGYDATFNSGGASQTALGTNDDVYTFTQLANGDDDQTVNISANDAAGAAHSMGVVLEKDSGGMSGRSIDEAINYINTKLQQSNDSTLQKIVAVKEVNYANNAEGIRFLSTLSKFNVSVGTTAGAVGFKDGTGGTAQGAVNASEQSSGGAMAAIDTQDGAEQAVTALADAVKKLGNAQAVVGKGQNSFSYAVNLAQSQLTNIAAAESRIRDADLASEAANLTKAQIILQAGIAALAQANSAPQQVLTLLRG